MTKPKVKVPVSVCPSQRHEGRWFGKYKHPVTGKWDRIPGGDFPESVKTRDQALAFAARWYLAEMQDVGNATKGSARHVASTWDDVVDEFLKDASARVLSDTTKEESRAMAESYFRTYEPFRKVRPNEITEATCLRFLRHIAGENIGTEKDPRKRKPRTVRNVYKYLPAVFVVGHREGWIGDTGGVPGLFVNPAEGPSVKQALAEIQRQVDTEVIALDMEDFVALVTSPTISRARRVYYALLGLTGLRPGEAAGLLFSRVVTIDGVLALQVVEQLAGARGKLAQRMGPLKTKWSERDVPVHAALEPDLRWWIEEGWAAYVGRRPKETDHLFPEADGSPMRAESETFRLDLEAAGCPTKCGTEPLTQYALRHTFSTWCTEASLHSGVHDRLMGHAPKGGTKEAAYWRKNFSFIAREFLAVPSPLGNGLGNRLGNGGSRPSSGDSRTATNQAISKLRRGSDSNRRMTVLQGALGAGTERHRQETTGNLLGQETSIGHGEAPRGSVTTGVTTAVTKTGVLAARVLEAIEGGRPAALELARALALADLEERGAGLALAILDGLREGSPFVMVKVAKLAETIAVRTGKARSRDAG